MLATFDSTTIRTARIPRLLAPPRQSYPINPKATLLTSVDSGGNRIAAVFISCLQLLDP
jgi:hypothetical protein